jgi:hypothetical protein
LLGRIVAVAVVALAAIAAADVIRGNASDERFVQPAHAPAAPAADLVRGDPRGYVADGPLAQGRVLRGGREVLSAERVRGAFPSAPREALFDIAQIAVAPDGTVVLGVVALPLFGPSRAAIELWRGDSLVGSFPVPSGSFAGGLGFSRDGRVVGWLGDGSWAWLFDRAGRRDAVRLR